MMMGLVGTGRSYVEGMVDEILVINGLVHSRDKIFGGSEQNGIKN